MPIQWLRCLYFRILSDNSPVRMSGCLHQPALFTGAGSIELGKCDIGFFPSPHFFTGYSHIEARGAGAKVVIGDGVWINNNATIIALGSKIIIGADSQIGPEFSVYDSDFHQIDPLLRKSGGAKVMPVIIGKNVFIGARVTVLKGVSIGDNSIIGSGAVVVGDIPPDVIAGGVPARKIRGVFHTANE